MARTELVIAGGGLTAARAVKSYREAGGDARNGDAGTVSPPSNFQWCSRE